MKKKVFKIGLGALLAANFLLLNEGNLLTGFEVHAADATKAEQAAEATKVKGKISNISQKAKTIALSLKDDSFFLLKFTDETKLKDIESTKELKEGEAVAVEYKTENGENIATSIMMELVKLPKGLKEIKTKELVDLIATDKNLVVIDSRPGPKYDEFHIPGAVSIPFSKLVAMGDNGAKLLEEYKDRQLVFYCGGST